MMRFTKVLPLMLASFLLTACSSSTVRSLPPSSSLADVSTNCPDLPRFPGGNLGALLKHESGVAAIYYQCRASYKALATETAPPAPSKK